MQVNGISVHVEDHGSGRPVLLLHGWPPYAAEQPTYRTATAAASGMAYRTGAIISVQRSRTGCCYLYRAYAISFAKTVVNRKSPVLF
jgi:hypothetical protein